MSPAKAVLAKHAKNTKEKQAVEQCYWTEPESSGTTTRMPFAVLGALGVLGEKQRRFFA